MISEKASEFISIVGTVDPDAYAAAAHSSDWVDMADYDQLLVVIMTGTLTSGSSTIDAKLQEANTAAGGSAKDISGKAITQVAAASPPTNDQQFVINLRAAELDKDNSFRWVKLILTVGSDAADAGAVLLGVKARYEPASGTDLASVAEIV